MPVVIIQEGAVTTPPQSDEGRAMLQLVHDIAPKAKLGFATSGSSQLQFADNIRSLAGLPGAPRAVAGFNADIIVDDVIFLTEPMFSDGIVAQGVIDVTAAGKHYFSSAGNRASTQGYAANFNFVNPAGTPTTGSNINLTGVNPALYAGGFHNFNTTGGQDIAQTLRRTAGFGSSNARLVFQWDDPFDKVVPGTLTSSGSGNFTGPAPATVTVTMTAGVPTRLSVYATVGSGLDAMVTVIDPNSVAVFTDFDINIDETIFFTPTVSGTYTISVIGYTPAGQPQTTGPFNVEVYENSTLGVTTEYNVLFFRADTGAFISAVQSNAFVVNQPVVFAGSIPLPAGQNTIQMVIARSGGTTANRLRYVFFDGSSAVRPDEYTSYQYPVTYGHNSSANGHGVAAFSAFRPYIPESFTSPGPVTIMFDAAGNRLLNPEIRQQPVISAMDGANNTFFGGDSPGDTDTFPNFFGTSAAAPNAAAVAALVLQAKGGPGSLTVAQMKSILINSTMPNDLDPQHAEAVIKTNGGTLTITLDADYTNASAVTTTLPLIDPNVFKVSYAGSGAIASISFNGATGNTTGGNESAGLLPGMVFDTRAIASNGLPFTLGTLVGLSAGNITPVLGAQAPSPAVAGQSFMFGLNFAPGSFTSGRSFGFNIDRDEHTVFLLPTGTGPQIGNSADLFGANVSIPQAIVNAGGVTVTGTMADGTAFSGTFVNKIGRGYSPLTGYGFLNAQRAVALATNAVALTVNVNGSGSGTVTSSPAGITCPGTCSADFNGGAPVSLTAAAAVGSQLTGFTGCDSVVGNVCTLNAPTLPSTVTATFTAVTAPDSPIIGVVARGNGQATINFTPPAYNGLSTITGYTASCAPGPVTQSGGSSPITVTGLTNGTTYSCSVVATNAVGNSPPSLSVNVTPATLPGAPTIGTATAGDTQASVSFTAPASNGGDAITSYTVTSSPGGITGTGAGSPIAVTGLTNGTAYTFTVTATNSVGTGVASAASNSVTPQASFLLSVLKSGSGIGSVSSAPAGITCGGDCSESFVSGTEVTLTASANAGSTFSSWSGVTCNGGNTVSPCVFTVTAAATVTAVFDRDDPTFPDFNADNKPDLIWSNTSSGATYIWRMNGATLISDSLLATIDPIWKVQGIGDFNGDGHPDVVWRNTSNGDTYVWYLVNGVLQSDAILFNLPIEWVIQGVADFNNDGKPDFLMRNTSSGNAFAWFFNNNVAIGDQFLFNIDPVWKVEGVGDFNADGQPDLLFRNTSSGLSFAWNTQFSAGNLSLTTSSAPIFSIDPVWEVVQVADWNNDGKPDLVFRSTASGLVFVWYMDGVTLTTSDLIIQIDPVWEIVPRR